MKTRITALMLIAAIALSLCACKRKDAEAGMPDDPGANEEAVFPAGYTPADGEDDVEYDEAKTPGSGQAADDKTEPGPKTEPKTEPETEPKTGPETDGQTSDGDNQTVTITAKDYPSAQRAFAYTLFGKCYSKGGNTLVSPMSVQTALALLANGANGATLDEIRNTALGGLDVSVVNEAVGSFKDDDTLKSANSVWLNADNGFKLTAGYDKVCKEYFNAEPESAPFNNSTLNRINGWVKDKTDGMIDGILDSLTPDMEAVLINALAFDAEWAEPYTVSGVSKGTFNNSDGGKAEAEYMLGSEYSYIDDGKATGFIKQYKDRKYAFAALLPNEGVSMEDYVAGLDESTLESVTNEKVITKMPKFTLDYSTDLKGVLMALGIRKALSMGADLSKLGSDAAGNPIYVTNVLHKTHIDVYEGGTRAAAVTAIIAKGGAAFMEEPKRVELTRPFVYMIFNTETKAPIFIGVADMLGKK